MTRPPDDLTLSLVRSAQAGDAVAVERLFERYRERLLQVVSLLRGRARRDLLVDEEDIVQETLLKAFRSLGSFEPRGGGSLMHWLTRLAENALTDAVRREQALKRGEGRVRPRVDLASAFLVSSIYPDGGPSPSEVAMGNELAERIEELLLELPERDRRTFVLRHLCGASYEDLAEELGLANAATARATYSRLTTRLLTLLPDADAG